MPFVEMEPRTSRFGVRRSTTTPPHELKMAVCIHCITCIELNPFIHFQHTFFTSNKNIAIKTNYET